jgi:hypothetical protein
MEAAMRCRLIILLSLVFWCSSGCMTCQNGLCSPGEPEAILDRNLLGEWAPIDPKPRKEEEGYFKVKRSDPNSKLYRVSAISLNDGGKGREPQVHEAEAYLTKFGDSLFLDVSEPAKPGRQSRATRHYIFKIEIKMPEITIWGLSEDFVRGHPDVVPSKVERSLLGIESVFVTATSKQLGDFVRGNAHVAAAWTKSELVLRHR